MTVPRHQHATLATFMAPSGALGYVLDGVPYGQVPQVPCSAEALARAHAAALEFTVLTFLPDTVQAAKAAGLAHALHRLAHRQELTPAALHTLRMAQGESSDTVLIRTDGSADKGEGGGKALSIGYLLNGQPYSLALHGRAGNEGIAEREAMFVALSHARALGFSRFQVRSDHKFHTRRYDEALAHPTRRKSESLERLDALVSELQPQVHFRYAPTLDTDAPHRLALHARAVGKLAQGLTLTRAERVALRRVHFALRQREAGRGADVLF